MIHNWQPNTNTKPAVLQHKHTYTHICTHTESAYVSFNHDDGNGWHFKYPKKQQQKREIYSFFSLFFSFNPSSIECVDSIEFNFIWKFHSFFPQFSTEILANLADLIDEYLLFFD